MAIPIGEADSIDAGAILADWSCCAGGDAVCDRGDDREDCAASREEYVVGLSVDMVSATAQDHKGFQLHEPIFGQGPSPYQATALAAGSTRLSSATLIDPAVSWSQLFSEMCS